MPEVMKVKLRKIGSSVGVLLPKEALDQAGAKVGDEIEIAMFRHYDIHELRRLQKIAKEFKEPFVRDKSSRY